MDCLGTETIKSNWFGSEAVIRLHGPGEDWIGVCHPGVGGNIKVGPGRGREDKLGPGAEPEDISRRGVKMKSSIIDLVVSLVLVILIALFICNFGKSVRTE